MRCFAIAGRGRGTSHENENESTTGLYMLQRQKRTSRNSSAQLPCFALAPPPAKTGGKIGGFCHGRERIRKLL
jgi:hypothetical protein